MKDRLKRVLKSEAGIIALAAMIAIPSLAFVSAPIWARGGGRGQTASAPGDSVSGTFASSTAAQVSPTLLAQENDAISVSLTAVTASSTTIVLESRIGGGAAWKFIKSYSTAATVADTVNNDFGTRLFLRLRANTIPSADTVTYALTRVVASRTVQEWFNNNGKSVLRINDIGVVTPKITATSIVGTVTGHADSATYALRADTAIRTRSTLTFGTFLTGTSFNGSAPITIATNATASSTASTLVARDASSNFLAGTITATLVGRADSATGAARAQSLTTARSIYGNNFDGTAALSGAITITSLTATASSTPASNAACTTGTLAWDVGFIYVCTASTVWKRAALTGGY